MAVVKPATYGMTRGYTECTTCGRRVMAVHFAGHVLIGCRHCQWYADAENCINCG